MTKLTALPEQAVISGFKGVVDFYLWKGIPVARKWPRSPEGPRTAAVQAQWPAFIAAARLWMLLSPEIQSAYRTMTAGGSLSGRDIFTRAYLTGLFDYPHVPPEPPGVQLANHWAPLTHTASTTAPGGKIIVTTDKPRHLTIRWTALKPHYYLVSEFQRGTAWLLKPHWALSAFTDKEQEEAGDTTTHTFLISPWPSNQTRYYYLWGTFAGGFTPSESPVLEFQRGAPPTTLTFYPDADPETSSVDGGVYTALVTGVSWPAILAHAGTHGIAYTETNYCFWYAAGYIQNTWDKNYRADLLYDTSVIPLGSQIISATLAICGRTKGDYHNEKPNLQLYGSNPVSNTALVKADYQRTFDVPFSDTPIAYDDLEVNPNAPAPNSFTLNPAGLAAITPGGISKFCLKNANFDVAGVMPIWTRWRGAYFNAFMSEKGGNFRPKLVVTFQA